MLLCAQPFSQSQEVLFEITSIVEPIMPPKIPGYVTEIQNQPDGVAVIPHHYHEYRYAVVDWKPRSAFPHLTDEQVALLTSRTDPVLGTLYKIERTEVLWIPIRDF